MELCSHCHQAYGDKLFCQHCDYHIPGRTFTSITSVPWSTSEKQIHSNDNDVATKATDEFISERAKWTATSPKLRKWEAGRKKEWARNKPAWRKEQAKKGVL